MYLVFSKSVIAYYIYMIIFLFRTLIEFSKSANKTIFHIFFKGKRGKCAVCAVRVRDIGSIHKR